MAFPTNLTIFVEIPCTVKQVYCWFSKFLVSFPYLLLSLINFSTQDEWFVIYLFQDISPSILRSEGGGPTLVQGIMGSEWAHFYFRVPAWSVWVIEEGRVASKSQVLFKNLAIFFLFPISQQGVSVDIIQNSAGGNFSPTAEGTKTKQLGADKLVTTQVWKQKRQKMADKSRWDQSNRARICKRLRKRDGTWDGILGHQFDKRLESFVLCYSQFLLLAHSTETILYSGFKIHTQYPRNKKTRLYSWITFLEQKNVGRKPDKTRNLDLKSHLWLFFLTDKK